MTTRCFACLVSLLLATVVHAADYGYLALDGTVLIEPKFKDAWGFVGDRAVVRGKVKGAADRFIIDRTGKTVAGPYSDARIGRDGLISVWNGEVWGVVDRDGKTVIPFSLYSAGQFREGFLPAQKERNGLFGYVNPKGEWAIEPRFKEAGAFSEGLAQVKGGSDIEGFIDPTGNTVIKRPSKNLWHTFANGIGCYNVYSASEWYRYVDRDGKDVSVLEDGKPRTFLQCTDFLEEYAAVKFSKTEVGLIDRAGKEVLRVPGDAVREYSDGLFSVKVSADVCYYTDAQGKTKLSGAGPDLFKSCEAFKNGVAIVEIQRKQWGVIDKTGKLIVAPNNAVLTRSEGGFVFLPGSGVGLLDAERVAAAKAQTGPAGESGSTKGGRYVAFWVTRAQPLTPTAAKDLTDVFEYAEVTMKKEYGLREVQDTAGWRIRFGWTLRGSDLVKLGDDEDAKLAALRKHYGPTYNSKKNVDARDLGKFDL